MKLLSLAQAPEYIDELAHLHFPQWQSAHPTWRLQDWQEEFRHHVHNTALKPPITILAFDKNNRLLGSASLLEDDMNGSSKYSPWLANVLVLPSARGLGVGSQLIDAITGVARKYGTPWLYLFTEDQQDFYQHRAWQEIEKCHYHDKAVSIMRKNCIPTKEVEQSQKA